MDQEQFFFSRTESRLNVSVLIKDDNTVEDTEDFQLSLVGQSGYGLGRIPTMTINIQDDNDSECCSIEFNKSA